MSLAISHFWQHSYGWIRRILKIFCNKHTYMEKARVVAFPFYNSKAHLCFSRRRKIVSPVWFHFVCLASCMIWFPYVTSCSCWAERREFLSIPKVVFPAQSYVGLLVFVSFPVFLILFSNKKVRPERPARQKSSRPEESKIDLKDRHPEIAARRAPISIFVWDNMNTLQSHFGKTYIFPHWRFVVVPFPKCQY